jgi:hypothetical protein
MPKQYESIRDEFMEEGMSEEEAKRRASKIFIAKGKGGSRSSRAKALHSDKYQRRRKPRAEYPSPKRK